jgi:hypothetical protein
MHPTTLRLTIAACLFVVIVAEFGFWFISQIPENPQLPIVKIHIEMPPPEAALNPTIHAVPFCELIKNPSQYNRKLIRTRAIFANGIDWASLRHNDCSGDDNSVGAVGPVEENDKMIAASSRSQIVVVLDRLMREQWDGPLEVDADMVGRFYVKPSGERQLAILYEFQARPTGRRW